MPEHILLVGHCGIDGPRLQSEIASGLNSQAERINTLDDLREACARGPALLLVNREPLGFTGVSGVDLIRQVKKEFPEQRAVLVSDLPEAQQEAEEAGALPGFGKADLGASRFTETIRSALGA